jgi:hypothetical protein
MKHVHLANTIRLQRATRNGSTLVIVVALLGMLAFLGFVFYTFSKQERASAVTFSQGAQAMKAPSLEPDSLWDFALQQLIIGPPDSFYQSILWGGRHSLLANMYGRNAIPWDGDGINLISLSGQPFVDMNYDGIPDVTADFLGFIDSPAANAGVLWGPSTKSLSSLPSPDAGYNYPDINSVFLSYDGAALNALTGVQSRVIIPSFFRPQYLRSGGTPDASWYSDPATATQVMRPHPEHVSVDGSGNAIVVNGRNAKRYVTSSEDYRAIGLRRPFTFKSFVPPESSSTATPGTLGVWTNPDPDFQLDIDLDVDTDGDGVKDAILMDLGYPPVRRGDGKLVVPLFAINVRDLNGLISLNASGNLSGNLDLNLTTSHQLGFNQNRDGSWSMDNISKSNLGLSTYEINPERALTALPSDIATSRPEIAAQLNYVLRLFGYPTTGPAANQPGRSVGELANLEWLMLNVGRVNFHLGLAGLASNITQLQNAIADQFSGRNGESVQTLLNGVAIVSYDASGNAVLAPLSVNGTQPTTLRKFFTTGRVLDLPKAGVSATWDAGSPPSTVNWPSPFGTPTPDDNVNSNEGETTNPNRWVHPLDFRGSGRFVNHFDYGADLRPGIKDVDDDGNGLVDDAGEEGWIPSDDHGADQRPGIAFFDDDSNGTVDDLSEAGAISSDDPTAKRGKFALAVQASANRWPAYMGYHSIGTVRWGEAATTGTYSGFLMSASRRDSLLDEGAEAIIDPMIMSPQYSQYSSVANTIRNDAVFGPEEMLFLQGSGSDARLTENRSRLAELMPGNLVASTSAPDIRKRLTTVSSDRCEFGFGFQPSGLRGGVSGTWESNPVFPPGISGNANPYRDELFALLKQQANGASQQQLRLNINQLLTTSGSQYQFRMLSEQTSVDDVAAFNDRQAMARDIYTLLYTLCQGQDADYRLPGGQPSLIQTKEMAQFAINYVDALDPDDIITAFYYDPDLSSTGGGWDRVYGPDGTAGNSDDTVVYGVERQLLTFAETVALRIKKTATNSDMTIFDDTLTDATNGRNYLYFELQNVTPMNVTLASSGVTRINASTSANWKVQLLNPTVGTVYNSMYLLSGLDSNNQIQIDANGNRILQSGLLFSVSSQDGTDKFTSGKCRTSDFRADVGFDGMFERNIPSGGAADTSGGKTVPTTTTSETDFPTPKCNLDLVWDYGEGPTMQNRFVLDSNTDIPGSFVSQMGGTGSIRLLLQRRAAAGGLVVWTTVDTTANSPTTSDVAVGEVTPPTTVAGAPISLLNIKSYPRVTPLSRTSAAVVAGANTINTVSTNTALAVAQIHNDRDFASLVELFQLPLCGPDQLTNGRISNAEFYHDVTSDPLNPKYYPTVAAARFLRPDNPDATLNGDVGNFGNRWYRLLDLLEVPNRSHRQLAVVGISGSTSSSVAPPSIAEPYNLPQFFGWPRSHGLVNINMIRHPQVLGALLDDDQVVNDPRFISSGTQYLDGSDESSRRWWVEFVKARDSRFHASSAFAPDPSTGLYIPGTADSRPFRSYDVVQKTAKDADSPLENTILRCLPTDGNASPANEARRLFEVGTSAEHIGRADLEAAANPTQLLPPSIRYRLLAKLMNNTTTRSNSFAVFVTAQYHEAVVVAADSGTARAVRIGGRLDDAPVHRGFFVIDRTAAVEQMKRVSGNPVSTNSFSFQPDTNPTGTSNGIRWKDLVLYRQTLN